MDTSIYITILFGILLHVTVDGCLLPLSSGTWISSTRGTWTVSDNGTHSTITNFEADLTGASTTATLECKSSSGTQYILGTSFEIFFTVFIDVYICIDIRTTSVSPNSYVYYIVTPTDTSTGEQFISDIGSACTNSNFETAVNTHVILKSGSETSAAVNYPDAILGNYTVDYYDIDGNSVTGSDMDSCNDTTLMEFNNADSNTKLAFTSGNVLQAVHSVTSGSSVYVHTYNRDASVTNPTTYSIACWVIVNSGSQVTATVYPEMCIQGQTSTSVAYGGQKFVFTPRYTCPLNETPTGTSSGLAGWQIALIVLGILAFIFIVIIIILYILYMRKQRHIEDSDPEKNKLKEERNSSPDSLQHDDIAKAKRQIQRFDEKGMNYPYKPRDKLEREHTSDLKEVKRPTKKLQDGKPADKDVKTSEREPVQPLIEFQPGKKPTPIDPLKDKKPPQIEPPPGKKQPPIEFPPGKKPIPPTTPKPDAEDTALLRIKKERERKEKERLEKKKKEQKAIEAKEEKLKKEDTPRNEIEDSKVIKNVRQSSSSDEYETDESEKQERIQKLLEKRKRLAAAAYQPPDGLPDAKVVGKKKRKNLKEGEDGGELTKSLTTREQQEILDKKRRHRKKAMKNMAKQKFKQSPSDMETSDSDADVSPNKRRFQRRKKGDPRGVEAPYTEQYHTKKGIEKELDDIDFWQEKVQPTVISDDEELDEQGNIKKRAIQVAPADTAQAPTEGAKDRSASRLAQIMEEEADVWAAHGLKGFKLGQGGELPEGFHFDEQGNIVRDVDGKVIPKEAFARLMDIRKKFGFVFSLPRLIRDSDGRPLGGYKDDEFGPTAEWDYGLPSNNEDEDEVKKSESFRPGSGKQVAFSVQDGQSVRATPLNDMDYSQIKGRQLGSAERLKLKDRLFESQPESDVKKSLPVFFAGSKGGIKPESVYISNAQIERQGNQTKAGNNRVVRSDTFDDGRGLRRNSKSRSTWSGRDKTGPSVIPENEETGGQQGMQGISRGKKNIGSDDEFILVGGSMQKINKQPYSNDSHLASHWCSRYERHGNLPIRETTEMSDLNMRTAPNSTRPFSGDDKRMKKLLQELYTDKKYFDHYLEAEKLPTIAAAETRGLASHGQQFLRERAEYWGEHQAVIPVQPPSELGLRLSRMRTFHTNVDSGMDSMITSTPGRPHSADDAQETERTRRENSEIVPPLPTNRSTKTLWTKEVDNTERKPPTGRSEAPPSPSKLESGKKEKSVTIEASPRDMKKPESKDVSKTNVSTKGKNVSEEKMLPRNVLTVTDT